jgi:translation initiation factor 2A
VYNVPKLDTPASQKNFFKGDKVQLKWNDNGTSLIVLAQTEVDKTGKSYYGETTMYLLSANGGFDSRIDLGMLSFYRTKDSAYILVDKEGPIHDVSWSPKSNSFAVVYGYMPAKTVIFNAKAQAMHTFALGPRNTVSFSPHGRFVLVAGFGNLAGQMDIYDLEKDYAKICTIEASNASVCEWSPDGKHILTATTSPRLRVDNGIRIWHASGGLMYNEDLNELYHVCWRPQQGSAEPLEENPFSPVPTPHASALKYLGTVKTPSKPAGAYRPPGARGQVTPLAFKREDEGGAAYVRDGISSFASNINGFGKPKPRMVPGAETAENRSPLPPGAAPGGGVSLTGTGEGKDGEPLSKAAKKNAKKREAKKAAAVVGAAATVNGELPSTMPAHDAAHPAKNSPSRSPETRGQGTERETSRSTGHVPAPVVPPGFEAMSADRQRPERSRSRGRRHRGDTTTSTSSQRSATQQNGIIKGPITIQQRGTPTTISTATPPLVAETPEVQVTSPNTPGSGANLQDKRVRGLLKKVRAIEDLKMRLASGEKLEDTQMKKIHSEDLVKNELSALGYTG